MINKILMTSSLLLLSTSIAAVERAPQQAPIAKQHIHGLDQAIDERAPTAQSQYRANETHHFKKKQPQLAKSKFTQLNNVASSAASSSCDLSLFATSNSNTLITQLKNQGSSCVNDLFTASSNIQQAAFTSDNMLAVANHVKGLSQNYSGGGDVDIEALFLYLRAGFYAEFYNDNVSLASWVTPAVRDALDAFVNNENFYQNNDAHGKTLSEVIITMDSSEQQDVYLPVVKEWLSRWDQSYADKWNMRGAVNGIFTILFRGQYNDNFKSLIANDNELVSLLHSFVMQQWMIDSEAEFLIANAAKELGRLKMYDGEIQSTVTSALTQVFNSDYQLYGFGDAVWLGAAETATYYGDCSSFGICGYIDQLEAQALSQVHVCSPTIKIRSQNLTTVQQTSACQTMAAEESYFHSKLATENTPIPGDNNIQLQVNIFNSSNDYGKYAGHIFGINTNNGGMYLEGDPSSETNIPNFVAYEASYAEPDHYIWNLEHEYVHYLDGRFDLFGDFSTPTEDVVWWSEGVAEYVSKQDNNQAAIDTIFDGSTYSLAEVFATNYDGFDQDRIYRWGYLAVRFMFENHFTDVKAMIADTRAGNWSAYKNKIDTWAANYGVEFTTWSQNLSNEPTDNIAPQANANGSYQGQIDQLIAFSSDGSTDTDGTIESYLWDFGDGTTSTLANPSHSYTQAGEYNVSLKVTDNQGAHHSDLTTVTITATSSNTLINKTWLNIAGDEGSENIYAINVPAGATGLRFDTSGGTGDADMYVKFGSEPSTNDYDCRPWQTGNTEVCLIDNVQGGTYYVMIRGYNSYQTYLMASFDAPEIPAVEDACAQQAAISSGQLVADQAVCLAENSTIWLSVADVNGHDNIAIVTAHGDNNLDIEFSNSGWPNGTNNDGQSANPGNNECIYLSDLSQYWGYIKVSGDASGASLVVRFDVDGCQ
ncbi:collagenase [Thalassotalea insulae]|uniref:microbial collagenase n=1 Tax=Thalassotalea insulae TaxID=2056778 RepID=A0ABQ6GYW1_9GAMM|nr:collagenase [Thalassotalea insulae]GLX79801.1 collagenase [Thalassotalea insulae]